MGGNVVKAEQGGQDNHTSGHLLPLADFGTDFLDVGVAAHHALGSSSERGRSSGESGEHFS